MDKETLNKYDKIMADVVANVMTEAGRADNKIYLKWFDLSKPGHRIYFHGAIITSDICKIPIYLDMPLYKYIVFKIKNRKHRKQLKWISQKKVPLKVVPTQVIIDHLENFHSMRPEADKKWQNILDLYYETKEEAVSENSSN